MCEMKCMLAYNYENKNQKNLKYIKHPWVMKFQVIQMKYNFFLKREIIIQRKHKTKLSASEPRRGESFARIYII